MGILSHFMNTDTLQKCIYRVLRPLIKLLIKYGYSHSEFAELAKKVYVDTAKAHFEIPNRKLTHSRISVLTGLSRKEVVRLSELSGCSESIKLTPNRAARVVTGWLDDEDFLDSNKQPKTLAIRGEQSFSTLVDRYSGDITAGAIVDELVRIGVAKQDKDNNTIQLVQHGYIPEGNDMEKMAVLSACAANLLETGEYNINRAEHESARFQRQLQFQQISPALAETFKQYSEQKSLELLLHYDEWLKQEKVKEEDKSPMPLNTTPLQIGVGIYHFED